MKVSNTPSFENELIHINIVVLSIFLNDGTSGNIVDFLRLLSICYHAMLCWIDLFLEGSRLVYKAFKFFVLENVGQV